MALHCGMLLLHPWADSEPLAQGSGSQGSHRPLAPECPGLVYWGEVDLLGQGPWAWAPGTALLVSCPKRPGPPRIETPAGDFSLIGGWV